jgi:hypothetical protein
MTHTEGFARGLVAFASAMLLLCVATLTACGGGGASTPTPPAPVAGTNGINGGGFARGAITGFGSIFVNGVEFSTSSATIRVEDSVASESQLKVGQIVVVKGTIASDGRTGTATTVTFDDALEGPIQSIDLATSRFVVLGQTVRVTGATVFDDSSAAGGLAALAVGNFVEVSGDADSAGVIVASRVERRTAAGEAEITGRISGLDVANRRFSLGQLVVDYAGATIANGTLANDACVEAKGAVNASNVLVASRVEVKACGETGAANDRAEVEAIITRFASATDFDIGTQKVTTTASTTFVNGTAGDLRLDVKVEAEGTLNAAGVLTATKIEIKPETSARLVGLVDAVTTASGTLTMFGVTITTNATTSFEDKSSAQVRSFRLADVRTGDYLEVRGFRGATANSMTATRVERRNVDSRREIQGPTSNVARPDLAVLGIAATTTGSTEYRDTADAAITADAFFAAATDRLVKLRGTWSGTIFTATQAEFENP